MVLRLPTDVNSVVWGGGAVYIASSDKAPRISNCIISNNTAYFDSPGTEGYKGGGAIYVGSGVPIFTNCLITNNSTTAYGGGVNTYRGSTDFINCTISENSALEGGGVYIFDDTLNVNHEFLQLHSLGSTRRRLMTT